ncbi:RQC-minor-1 family DNA-binding protein [Jeotgalibacillus proteolyticus]|uniref:RQC-minor-1 family DNA-binding protein n=1 Tax=Jeotgalibacillus proteolyticus TaxID=2082395 RepID=UPI001FD63BAA|nr:RQC-minor-1 family DNA-binding protein [Jeotgalibacillus proteolyticus]
MRAADSIIAEGGKTLLAKILKGSKDKKVLQLGLDKNPSYGFYKGVKLDDVLQKIEWMIDYRFLEIKYFRKLPLITFTDLGWLIERDQYTDEFINEWREWIREGKQNPDMSYLKDRNREMILLLLDKVKESGDQSFIPYLELWAKVDYKKVKAEIQYTIDVLKSNEPVSHSLAEKRQDEVNEALKGVIPHDIRMKCWSCTRRFTWTIGEQKFYREKGLSYPKKCKICRGKGFGYS